MPNGIGCFYVNHVFEDEYALRCPRDRRIQVAVLAAVIGHTFQLWKVKHGLHAPDSSVPTVFLSYPWASA